MSTLLTASELETVLGRLPGWTGDTGGITRTYQAPEFPTGIRLVDAVAESAERADHHPDIDIRWRKVTFRLVTHSAGGVTDKDIDLAGRIDELAGQLDCS
jgi:4a-hydroxytetrahydrobiopterin dehydratase